MLKKVMPTRTTSKRKAAVGTQEKALEAKTTPVMETRAPPKKKAAGTQEIALATKLFGKQGLESDSESDSGESSADESIQISKAEDRTHAKWRDEDDEDEAESVEITEKKLRRVDDTLVNKKEYAKRLRDVFVRRKNAGKTPKWASTSNKKTAQLADDSDSDADDILKAISCTAMAYVEKDQHLSKGFSKARLLKDITVGHSTKKTLNVLRFHRKEQLLITAGDGEKVSLFMVDSDARKDHFVRGIKFKNFPISSFDFVNCGKSIVAGSRSQSYFMRCDIETAQTTQLRLPNCIPRQNTGLSTISKDSKLLAMAGKFGEIYIIALASMELIRKFNASKSVVSLEFSSVCNDELWAATESGSVFVFRVGGASSPSSTHSFSDDGCVRACAVTLSPDGSYVAVGANTGIVNVYSSDLVRQSAEPQPLFSMDNLRTAVSSLSFNHDSQILAAGSDVISNALRAMHVHSGTVFIDLPTKNEKLAGASSIAFSPHSRYMAVGTKAGETRLYEIDHFDDY